MEYTQNRMRTDLTISCGRKKEPIRGDSFYNCLKKTMFLDSSTITKTFDIIGSSIIIVEANLYTFKATRFCIMVMKHCMRRTL